ncbi:hypothetical protein [Brevundimonas sp.]|uniref:hypothetical protein n=1 Tax=Brevundimonas sp. TaxID=1871086 RepID=UPI002AB88176|nr:hypothetical protein [Brevundimonas sp.]MDZ4364636.1 hypothetical protein [Brevundimonas sp.]
MTRTWRTATAVLALTAIGAGACASPPAPVAALPAQAAVDPMEACPDLAEIDYPRLPPEAVDRREASAQALSRNDAAHAQTRGPFFAFVPPEDAQVVLRMHAPGTATQNPRTDTSSTVWKDAQGTWRVNRVDYRPDLSAGPMIEPPLDWDGIRPLPQPSPEEIARYSHTVVTGRLDPVQARELDAALADPCLALQPDWVGRDDVWLKAGRIDYCYGGTGGLLDMIVDGRRRQIYDSCSRWTGGRIMRVVMYARAARFDGGH